MIGFLIRLGAIFYAEIRFNLQYLQEVRNGEIVESKVNKLQTNDEKVTYHQIGVGEQIDAIAEIEWY